MITAYAQIQPFEKAADRFIGHADEAEVAMVARNFAEGKGMTTDTVWLLHNGGQPGNEISHPEGYWSIYVAAVLAGFFKVFGANRVAVLLAASLMKIGIAALGFYWIRRLTKHYFAAVAGGIILLVHPVMAERVSAFSDIYLTFFILAAFTALILATETGKHRSFFFVGILAGLAIGMKPTGLILLGVIPVWILLDRDHKRAWQDSWLMLLGLAISVTPLAIHNYRAGGSIWWPDAPLVASAARAAFLASGEWKGWGSWQGVAAWNASAYDPTSKAVHFVFGSWDQISQGAANFLAFCKAALRGDIVPLWLLPFVFHVVANQVHGYLKSPVGYKGLISQITAVTILLCGAGLVLAARVHPEARYWNFLIPFLVIIGIVGAATLSRAILIFLFFWCSIAGAAYHFHLPVVVTNVSEYRLLDDLLPKDAVVMTSNPWELSFHTRRRAVALPYTSNPKVVTDLAERYGVKNLVVIRRDARHPSFDALERGTFPNYLKKIYFSRNVVVGQFVGNTASSSEDPLAKLFSEAFKHQKAGRTDLAIDLYKQLLSLSPNHRQGTFNLAYAYLNSNVPSLWVQSASLFQEVLEIDPQYFEAIHHLATAYWKIGNDAEGVIYDHLYLEKGRHPDLRARSQDRLLKAGVPE